MAEKKGRLHRIDIHVEVDASSIGGKPAQTDDFKNKVKEIVSEGGRVVESTVEDPQGIHVDETFDVSYDEANSAEVELGVWRAGHGYVERPDFAKVKLRGGSLEGRARHFKKKFEAAGKTGHPGFRDCKVKVKKHFV